MKKVLVFIFVFGISLYAGSQEYECVEDNYDESQKVIVDTTWYGKPTTISFYNKKDSLKGICKNAQTKIEYLQDNLAKFYCKKDGFEFSITLSKNAPYKLIGNNITKNRTFKSMCRKK